MSEPQTGRPGPYAPRRYRFAGLWQTAGWRLKAYGIEADEAAAALSPAVLAAARRTVDAHIAASGSDEGFERLGFVIVHRGEEGLWLPLFWWHGDILCSRLFRADPQAEEPVFTPVAEPFVACVWELVVVQHETAAWAGTLMGTDPDPNRYLARILPDGVY